MYRSASIILLTVNSICILVALWSMFFHILNKIIVWLISSLVWFRNKLKSSFLCCSWALRLLKVMLNLTLIVIHIRVYCITSINSSQICSKLSLLTQTMLEIKLILIFWSVISIWNIMFYRTDNIDAGILFYFTEITCSKMINYLPN